MKESTLSLILGLFIVLVAGVIVFNYFGQESSNNQYDSSTATICYALGTDEIHCIDVHDYYLSSNKPCVEITPMLDQPKQTICGSFKIITNREVKTE